MPDDVPETMTDAIRVLICDDHALFRRGLIMVLESEEGIDVVAEAEDGEEAVRKAEESAPDGQDPDADGERRRRGPVRGGQGRGDRLPAEGDLDRGGRQRHPRRGDRS